MELFFRKYFWVVNLAFLLAAAFFSAKTVNALLYPALAPLPDFRPRASAAVVAQQKTSVTGEALSKLTGIPLPKEPEVVEPQPSQSLEQQEATRTSLRLKLLGTLVANQAEWSMATVEDGGENRVYMVGDEVADGVTVLEIERLRVTINNRGHKEYLDDSTGEGGVQVGHLALPAGPVTPAPPDSGSGIRSTSENLYEVPREEIDKALNNLNDIAMQARIVPAFKNGVATGFKLFSIRPDSLYTKIGIQNGDIIRRINGFEINSPDKALEIYAKLKEASRVEIEIDRNGSTLRKTYNVR